MQGQIKIYFSDSLLHEYGIFSQLTCSVRQRQVRNSGVETPEGGTIKQIDCDYSNVKKGTFPVEYLNHAQLKHSFTTHVVPLEMMASIKPLTYAPQVGDIVVAEVMSIGKHSTIETRDGVSNHIFPGDRVVVTFGNRYATDQYEGYVPTQPVIECDMLSVGGV